MRHDWDDLLMHGENFTSRAEEFRIGLAWLGIILMLIANPIFLTIVYVVCVRLYSGFDGFNPLERISFWLLVSIATLLFGLVTMLAGTQNMRPTSRIVFRLFGFAVVAIWFVGLSRPTLGLILFE
jgi:hypothetical protein